MLAHFVIYLHAVPCASVSSAASLATQALILPTLCIVAISTSKVNRGKMPNGRGRPPFSVLLPISFLSRSRLVRAYACVYASTRVRAPVYYPDIIFIPIHIPFQSRFGISTGSLRDMYWTPFHPLYFPLLPSKGRLEALRRISCLGHIFYRPGCAEGRKVPSRASGAILRLWYACRIAVEGPRSLSAGLLRLGGWMYRPEAEMALRGSTVAIWRRRGKSGLTG